VSKRTGRPSKYCVTVVRTITEAISDGVPITHAATIAGVSLEWVCQKRRQHPDFDRKIREAVSAAIQSRLAIVKRATESADESIALRAACWWLTHTPGAAEHFSESRRVQLTGADGAPLTAGIQLFLPRKETSVVECNEKPVPALTEGSPDESD
jgi:hypothetical protein